MKYTRRSKLIRENIIHKSREPFVLIYCGSRQIIAQKNYLKLEIIAFFFFLQGNIKIYYHSKSHSDKHSSTAKPNERQWF